MGAEGRYEKQANLRSQSLGDIIAAEKAKAISKIRAGETWTVDDVSFLIHAGERPHVVRAVRFAVRQFRQQQEAEKRGP